MFCPECGKHFDEGNKFCAHCGVKLDMFELNPEVAMSGNEIKNLVELAKNGDESAFQSLYEKTNRRNYYVALKMVKSDADAQDVLQDAYIRIYQHLDQFTYNGEGSFASWTSKIVSNTALNHLRKKQMVFFSDIEGDQEGEITLEIEDEDESRQPELAYDRKETSRIVQELLGNLSDEQRVCAMMYYYQEQSVKEIASEIGCSENTVKSRLNYARRNMMGKAEELKKRGILTGILSMAGLFAILRSKEAMAMVHVPAGAYSAVADAVNIGGVVSSASTAGEAMAGGGVSSAAGTAGASAESLSGIAGMTTAQVGAAASTGAAVSTGIGLKIAIGSIIGAAVIASGTAVVLNLPKSENKPVVESTMIPESTPEPVTGSAVDEEKEEETPEPTESPDYSKAYKDYFKHRKGVISVPGANIWNLGDQGFQELNQIQLDLKSFQKKEIVDIDKDGVPELIMGSSSHYLEEFEAYDDYSVEDGEEFFVGSMLVCSYIDGEVTPMLGINGLRGSAFLASDNRLCAFFGGSNFGEHVFFIKEGNEFKFDMDLYFDGMNHTEDQWPHTYIITDNTGNKKEITEEEYLDCIEKSLNEELFK